MSRTFDKVETEPRDCGHVAGQQPADALERVRWIFAEHGADDEGRIHHRQRHRSAAGFHEVPGGAFGNRFRARVRRRLRAGRIRPFVFGEYAARWRRTVRDRRRRRRHHDALDACGDARREHAQGALARRNDEIVFVLWRARWKRRCDVQHVLHALDGSCPTLVLQ